MEGANSQRILSPLLFARAEGNSEGMVVWGSFGAGAVTIAQLGPNCTYDSCHENSGFEFAPDGGIDFKLERIAIGAFFGIRGLVAGGGGAPEIAAGVDVRVASF